MMTDDGRDGYDTAAWVAAQAWSNGRIGMMVNPNTGEPLNDHRRTEVARNTVFHDREHPSQIVLPVIPAGEPLRGSQGRPDRRP